MSQALVDMFELFCKQIMPDEDPEQMATHAIRIRCEEMLVAFPSTANDDLEAMENAGDEMSARARLATEFRLRKKAILQHFLMEQGTVEEDVDGETGETEAKGGDVK